MLQSKDFLTTGRSASGITYTFLLRVAEVSTDVAKNSSHVSVQAILQQSFSGTGFSGWGTGVSCSINGSEIFSDYAQRRISGLQEHVFYTWEGELPHNDDGSLQLTISGRLWQNASASYTPPAMQVQGDMALTVLTRASSVNASSGNIGETVMIAVGKKNDRFTHTIAYRFGAEEGYIDADGNAVQQPVQLSAASCAFRLPESFYGQIPDDPSGQCQLTCTTYDGALQVGQPQSCTFTATAERISCQPVLSGQVRDVNPVTLALTGDENTLIRYASTARCSVEAAAKNGAYLETVTVNGVQAPQGVEIEQAESGSFVFSAVDSRGYETRQEVETLLLPYVKLTCHARPGRTDPATGTAKVEVEGSCYCGHFGAVENSLILRYRLAGQEQEVAVQIAQDHSYRLLLELSGLDYTQEHMLVLTVQDQIEAVEVPVRIGQAIPVFYWQKEKFCFNVPLFAPAVNDRGICPDADTARSPGVYRLTGTQPVGEGLLLVWGSGDMTVQLAIGASGRKLRLLTEQTMYQWEDL